MDYLYLIFVVLAFVAVVLALEGIYLFWSARHSPEARKIERRLKAVSAAGDDGVTTSLVKERRLSGGPLVHAFLLRLPHVHALDRFLLQAGSPWSVGRLLGYSAGGLVGGFLAALLMGLPLALAPAVAIAGACLPFLRLMRSRMRRMRKLEEQFPEVLDLMSRGLRAGHAFSTTLQMVATEAPEPIAGEFRILFDEMNFGIPFEDAIANLAGRVPVSDFRYFAVAVLIQRETGGNLAELLDNTATLLRARFKLLGTIRVLSAEGRLSAWILGLLPFAVGGVIQLLNPGFLTVLFTDPFGKQLVMADAFLLVTGILWMWRMVKIRV